MATLVIGAVAAWAAPAGYAALAFSVGSAVGAAMFGPRLPTVEGPKLNDLRVQSSAYGEMLPLVYGSARVSGKLMWSQAIRQTRHESRSGGKGGGGQKVVTYTYSCTFAVAICQAPAAGITGIRRIWANGELIYSAADDATAQTLIASNQAAAGMAIYTGASTQTADATIQAAVGAANCPAYRGTAYIVFSDLQLEKYGNRVPSLEFEVVNVGAATPFTAALLPITNGVDEYSYLYASIPIVQQGGYRWHREYFGEYFYRSNIYSGVIDTVPPLYLGVYTTYYAGYDRAGNPIASSQNGSNYCLIRYTGGAWEEIGPIAGSGADFEVREVDHNVYWYAGGVVENGDYSRTTYTLPSGYTLSETCYSRHIYGAMFLRLNKSADSTKWLAVVDTSNSAVTVLAQLPGSSTVFLTGALDGTLWFAYSGAVYQYDQSGTQLGSITLTGGTPSEMVEVAPGLAIAHDSSIYWKLDIDALAQISTGTATSHTLLENAALDGTCYAYSGAGTAEHRQTWLINHAGSITLAGLDLDDIVTDLCARVGLAAGDIDVTDLTATVPGYLIARRMNARAAIEPLQAAYYFDATESDSKLKFVARGGSSAVTIPEDDLAAHEAGNALPDTVEITRAQEMELPVEVTVTYIDKDAAYQTGTQNSRRLTTSSKSTADLQLPISLTAAKAKEIADVALFDAWMSRNTLKFSTTREYTKYEPTDVISVVKGGVTHTVRLLGKNEAGGLIHWDAVSENISIYTQASEAVGPTVPSDAIAVAGPTLLKLLDIPLLRDSDDDPGFYAAACGYLAGWPGAQLYKSIDDSATWDEAGDGFLNEAAIGLAESALGDFTGGNIFDESSTVTVTLISGTLASTTGLAVLNGANAALIGDEVLQFKTATLTSGSTYTLSGFLRGRRGTEWAMASHVAGEDFILLTATTLYRLPAQTSEIGLARDYKGVSFGGLLDDAATEEFTNTAMGLECYAPVQVGGGRDASSNLTINWVRRTRIGGEWRDYVDAPLGETTESYEVDILNGGGTVLRTITASSATASYTAAQQTTDFGSPQSAISIKVYQLSATVGRGIAASATV